MNWDRPIHFTLLGYPLGFAHPLALSGLLLALSFGALALYLAWRHRTRAASFLSNRLVNLLAPGASSMATVWRTGCYSVGLTLFVIALAQPQCGSRSELTKRRGIDVVVALDASKSMLARDVQPSRLERAKLELSSLLDSLKGDRIAIVVFAGDAFIQCPLTSDYAAAKMFLRAVDPEQMQQGGTNIGEALLLTRKVLDNADRGSKDKVVVLLSDGEDLSGEINPGLDALKEAGVRVFTIGIGSESGEPIPILDKKGEVVGYKKDSAGNTVLTRLDRAGLIAIAETTGGEFFYQPQSVATADVISRIDKLQKSELESRLTVRYDERFQVFVFPGLAFLVAGTLIAPRRRSAA